MNIYFSDIFITAHSEESLERIMANPFLSDEAFKKYYAAHPEDDRTYLCDPERTEAKTPTIKYHTSSRGFKPIDYFRSLLKRTGEDIVIDLRIYDEAGEHRHYRQTQEALFEVFDQEDYEIYLNYALKNKDVDKYDLVHEYISYYSPSTWIHNIDEDGAPIIYGEELILPDNYIPDSIKDWFKHDRISLLANFDFLADIGRSESAEEAKELEDNEDMPF